jgi:hypothetical protein
MIVVHTNISCVKTQWSARKKKTIQWMIGLEINLISIIPLISSQEDIYTTEASLKYFIIQALASSNLLFLVVIKTLAGIIRQIWVGISNRKTRHSISAVFSVTSKQMTTANVWGIDSFHIQYFKFPICINQRPVTVAARSKAWTVFARSNAGVVGSNLTRGMEVCVYSVFVLGSELATGWSLIQEVLPKVLD